MDKRGACPSNARQDLPQVATGTRAAACRAPFVEGSAFASGGGSVRTRAIPVVLHQVDVLNEVAAKLRLVAAPFEITEPERELILDQDQGRAREHSRGCRQERIHDTQ